MSEVIKRRQYAAVKQGLDLLLAGRSLRSAGHSLDQLMHRMRVVYPLVEQAVRTANAAALLLDAEPIDERYAAEIAQQRENLILLTWSLYAEAVDEPYKPTSAKPTTSQGPRDLRRLRAVKE